ncbi:hypothetical protein [Criblamydia sequanensis]|uniref:Uncharacterized protein n=1 Tax=Candidatus Criblamydia sequanensis CRIB-18 TaxID=1437425 RepID=A0A090D0D7_9BACT|nr:hypothetical protein [Criblamydia sequanensis]CDR34997.1 hypothetical protein CSEC_2191 [Criblamydia sequanensis CRIB-18]
MWGDDPLTINCDTEQYRAGLYLSSRSQVRNWGHSFVSYQEDHFSKLFPELRAFDEGKDVLSLIEKGAEKSSWSNIFNRSQDKNKQFKNLFREWRQSLDETLDRVRYDERCYLLERLKKIVEPILNVNLAIVKLRLMDDKLFSEKTELAFNQFENLLKKVLETPTIEQIRSGNFEKKQSLPIIPSIALAALTSPVFRSLAPFAVTRACLLNKRLIQNRISRKTLKKSKSESDLSKLSCLKQNKPNYSCFPRLEMPEVKPFTYLLPSFGPNWEEHLAAAFKKLPGLKEITAAARICEQTQVLSLITQFLRDETVFEKLAITLCSLKGEVFLAVVSASEDRISELNLLFKHFKERRPKLAECRFQKLSKELVLSSNFLRDRIDAYAEKFRSFSGNNLSSLDLQEIYSLRQHVRLKIETFHLFKDLFKEVLSKAETQHVILLDLLHEHEIFLKRLTEKSTQEQTGGALLAILNRIIFEDSLFDETIEFIGQWSICGIEDYHKFGIYGGIALKELPLDKNECQVRLIKLAAANLAAVNLASTQDLQQKEIYNKKVLASYLADKNIQAALKKRTLQNLPLIYFEKTLDLFEEWFISKLRDYHSIGLYGEISPHHLQLNNEEYETSLRSLAIANLEAIGLSKTDDLQQKEIYSLSSLRGYLMQEEIKLELTERTKKVLPLIFLKETIDLLKVWDLVEIEDFHAIGLYGDIPLESLKIEKNEYEENFRMLALDNLETMGLSKTFELELKEIYDRSAFAEYLAKTEIKSTLTELTLQNLSLIFQKGRL